MKTLNAFRCSFPANSANEALARAALSAFLIPADPTAQELADLRTVISEAVTNAIVHGYRGTTGEVAHCLRMLPERVLYMRVADKGCGIPDVAKAMEPLYTTGGGTYARQLGGRGVAFGPHFPGDPINMHNADESMDKENFFKHAQICLEAMYRLYTK